MSKSYLPRNYVDSPSRIDSFFLILEETLPNELKQKVKHRMKTVFLIKAMILLPLQSKIELSLVECYCANLY